MRLFHHLWLFILWLNVDKSLQQNAQQCPMIHVDNNVQVIGNPEEANYGNVVGFSCKSNTEILSGPSEIYCDENGEWSDRAPICEGIKCSEPVIENGFVPGDTREYKEHEVLYFACNPKYKRSEDRPSKCTKLGIRAEWSPTPACEPIKCKLTLPPLGGTRYDPAFRSLFSPDDTVRVICGEKYWISTPQDASAVSTCQEDGQWTIRPVCHEVTCRNQRDPLMSYWSVNRWQKITLGDTASYNCRSGYKSTGGATEVTCTRDGWSPNPPCQEPLGCGTPPLLANADIKNTMMSQYSHDERVEYMCQNYYVMEGEPYRTCISGEWTGQMRCLKPCTLNEDNTRQHNITFTLSDSRYLLHDEIIEFRCARGQPVGDMAMHQRCNSGVVLLPACQ